MVCVHAGKLFIVNYVMNRNRMDREMSISTVILVNVLKSLISYFRFRGAL